MRAALLHVLLLAMASASGSPCQGRQGAAKGSAVWCRCSRREEPIRSQRVCETSDGGRDRVCQWSVEKGSCLQKAAAATESSQLPHDSSPHSRNHARVGCPQPRGNATRWAKRLSAAGHHLTLATWNVEWLFDGVNDPPPVPQRGSASDVSARVTEIAKVLSRIDADLINFAEVENCDMLSKVAAEVDSSYEPFLIEGKDIALRQQVGLLSRLRPLQNIWRTSDRSEFPIPGSKCGYDADGTGDPKTTSVSKHLVAHFSPIPGHELVVIGVHFKAMPVRPDACAQREGQASIIRGLIRQALETGKHVVVMGDLNDFDPDVHDAGGQVPTSSVLRMLKDVDDDGKPELWNALEMVSDNERYTNWFDRNRDHTFQWDTERSLLDHILISQSLRPLVEAVGIDHSHDPSHLSDHWPVWVRFNLSSLASGPATENAGPAATESATPSLVSAAGASAMIF